MATAVRGSFLPTIKCSDCGLEVEFMAMADHVCSMPVSASIQQDAMAKTNLFDKRQDSSQLRLPSINPGVANRPYIRTDHRSTGSGSSTESNNTSPSTPDEHQSLPLASPRPSNKFGKNLNINNLNINTTLSSKNNTSILGSGLKSPLRYPSLHTNSQDTSVQNGPKSPTIPPGPFSPVPRFPATTNPQPSSMMLSIPSPTASTFSGRSGSSLSPNNLVVTDSSWNKSAPNTPKSGGDPWANLKMGGWGKAKFLNSSENSPAPSPLPSPGIPTSPLKRTQFDKQLPSTNELTPLAFSPTTPAPLFSKASLPVKQDVDSSNASMLRPVDQRSLTFPRDPMRQGPGPQNLTRRPTEPMPVANLSLKSIASLSNLPNKLQVPPAPPIPVTKGVKRLSPVGLKSLPTTPKMPRSPPSRKDSRELIQPINKIRPTELVDSFQNSEEGGYENQAYRGPNHSKQPSRDYFSQGHIRQPSSDRSLQNHLRQKSQDMNSNNFGRRIPSHIMAQHIRDASQSSYDEIHSRQASIDYQTSSQHSSMSHRSSNDSRDASAQSEQSTVASSQSSFHLQSSGMESSPQGPPVKPYQPPHSRTQSVEKDTSPILDQKPPPRPPRPEYDPELVSHIGAQEQGFDDILNEITTSLDKTNLAQQSNTGAKSSAKNEYPSFSNAAAAIVQIKAVNETRIRKNKEKSVCRVCQLIIEGERPVFSSDGKLSGKFHKKCFSCASCRVLFYPSAATGRPVKGEQPNDFYVFQDKPYCPHDYHVKNNSLCRECNTGIEGQCRVVDFDTLHPQRYHLECFCCAIPGCDGDFEYGYYEVGKQKYCVKHAPSTKSTRRFTRMMF